LPWLVGVPIWIFSFGLGEETGGRGFALPHLQANRSAMSATYIALWTVGAWHLPTFTYSYDELNPFMFLGFVIGIMAGAGLLTSLFNVTGGSPCCSLCSGTGSTTRRSATLMRRYRLS